MARVSTFSRDLKLMVDRALSPEARSKMIAERARAILKETQDQNQRVLGVVPPHETTVDRRRGAALETVNPDKGVIVFEFEIRIDVFDYIGEMLIKHSPVLSGEFQRSHRLFADGVEVAAYDPAIEAQEWVFTTPLPYARRLERGSSDQAPDGVFEAVAALAAERFGNVAAIKFTFRSLMLDYVAGEHGKGARKRMQQQPARRSAMAMERATRQPAILVRIY